MKEKVKVLEALALLSQIGIAIIVPIIGGVWLGDYLDSILATEPLFLILGVILGVIVGFRNAYRLLISQQDSGK
ncbi:hypothetical protein JCM16358_13710 [Halanaerocella petrolearia]